MRLSWKIGFTTTMKQHVIIRINFSSLIATQIVVTHKPRFNHIGRSIYIGSFADDLGSFLTIGTVVQPLARFEYSLHHIFQIFPACFAEFLIDDQRFLRMMFPDILRGYFGEANTLL